MTEQERSIYVNAIIRHLQWADDREINILYYFTTGLIDPPKEEIEEEQQEENT